MMKNVIRTINDTEAQVTKAFAKKAVIFGTEEYKLWKAYRADFPEAKMVTKTIKKKVDKKVETRNLTYKNMETFISIEAPDKMAEFGKQKKLSKIQSNPYRAVLAWFLQEFQNYDSYKEFYKALEAQREAA